MSHRKRPARNHRQIASTASWRRPSLSSGPRACERDSGFADDAGVTTGAYSIIADGLDWFPKIVSWLLFGTRGNLAEGSRALETAAQRGTIGAPDARLLLSVLYTRQKRFIEAKAVLSGLLKAYPENYLIHLDIAGTVEPSAVRRFDRAG